MSVDEVGARELQLFIENDSQLYRQQFQPIQKNLRTKQARGIYDHVQAVKAFEHLATNGAKRYGEEFGGDGLRTFSPSTRRAVARELTRHFEVESDIGNYDYLLPKKYKKKLTAAERMEHV